MCSAQAVGRQSILHPPRQLQIVVPFLRSLGLLREGEPGQVGEALGLQHPGAEQVEDAVEPGPDGGDVVRAVIFGLPVIGLELRVLNLLLPCLLYTSDAADE